MWTEQRGEVGNAFGHKKAGGRGDTTQKYHPVLRRVCFARDTDNCKQINQAACEQRVEQISKWVC